MSKTSIEWTGRLFVPPMPSMMAAFTKGYDIQPMRGSIPQMMVIVRSFFPAIQARQRFNWNHSPRFYGRSNSVRCQPLFLRVGWAAGARTPDRDPPTRYAFGSQSVAAALIGIKFRSIFPLSASSAMLPVAANVLAIFVNRYSDSSSGYFDRTFVSLCHS